MMTSNAARRVVVTGIGALSPIGNSPEEAWKNLINGVSGGGMISKFDTSVLPVHIACEIRDFDLQAHFSNKEINRFDRLTLYALYVARQAWENSGLSGYKELDNARAGVIWASGNGGIESIEASYMAENAVDGRYSPYLIPKTLIDTPSGMICLEFGLRGINYCPVSACASSSTAFMNAFDYIRWGKADVMLAGGSEAPITHLNIGGFAAMKALSRNNENPAGASRPMDAARDGFVMGEGAGILILEELTHALNRGATILAEVTGAGMSNDAYHATATHPEGEGAIIAVNMALEESGIEAAELDYVNLHATSTPVGDLSELNALARLIPAESRKEVFISSTKGATGHLLGASGAIEGVFTVQSLLYNVVPPTINVTQPDENLPEGFSYVWQKAVKNVSIRYAMSNNFGFGGHNAVVIFRKYDNQGMDSSDALR